MKLEIVIGSTRDGRQGAPIADWFVERAKAHGRFDVELADLREIALPLFDEPHHPRLRKYQHDHTKQWSARIDAADAFVFVTPEYNYFAPPALVNAIDYLSSEWAYKPLGFVSYGGISGGTRSVQALKPLATSVKMMPLPEAVSISFFMKQIQDGRFVPNDENDKAAIVLLDELNKWAQALATMRT